MSSRLQFALINSLPICQTVVALNVQIINTGSELMLGRVLNTHQQWLCRELADLGYRVHRQVAVDDSAGAIEQAVREGLSVADLLITTGGLGPTSDDRTRDLIAGLLRLELREDSTIVANIEKFFALRKRPMPAMTRVQALVPHGAMVVPNAHGTAPGLIIEVSPNPFRANATPSRLIMLPGPPRELRPMFSEQVVPWLRTQCPLANPFVCHTLKTTGLGESVVQERIAGPLHKLTEAGLELGYCARVGEVDVRVVAQGEEARQKVIEAERIIRSVIGHHIFGHDDETLESVLIRLLTERRQTLALAESCTGGRIADRLTNVPGASAVLICGLVTYSNEAKRAFLGVQEKTLATHGAVSEAVAREMAQGARQRSGADYALAVTGIAGPTGGTTEKPVGTAFIALASAEHIKVLNPLNRYDRETFKETTSQQALELLRRMVL